MIIYAAYRNWAIKACKPFLINNILVTTKEDLLKSINIHKRNIQAIIFVGWSTIIPDEIINTYLCMCYHPSDLPKFRGGSPIQNQILNGVEITKGTLFKMNNILDGGDIYKKAKLSLPGNMDNILQNLTKNAKVLIRSFVKDLNHNTLKFTTQNENEATLYKRRKPEMSEITIDELQNSTAKELYDKIRCLGDPYPNAFIKTIDGKKLLIKLVEIS